MPQRRVGRFGSVRQIMVFFLARSRNTAACYFSRRANSFHLLVHVASCLNKTVRTTAQADKHRTTVWQRSAFTCHGIECCVIKGSLFSRFSTNVPDGRLIPLLTIFSLATSFFLLSQIKCNEASILSASLDLGISLGWFRLRGLLELQSNKGSGCLLSCREHASYLF